MENTSTANGFRGTHRLISKGKEDVQKDRKIWVLLCSVDL